jgi:hypothetical protein
MGKILCVSLYERGRFNELALISFELTSSLTMKEIATPPDESGWLATTWAYFFGRAVISEHA